MLFRSREVNSTLPRTIVFLTHSAAWSGAEIALFHLVTHLDQAKWKPVVVVFEPGLLRQRLQEAGIETRLLRLDPRVSRLRRENLGAAHVLNPTRIGILWRFCHALTRLLQREGACIVHCNSLKADFLGGVAGKWAKIPTLWHIHDRIAPDYLPRAMTRFFPLALRILGARAVAVSGAVRETLQLPKAQKKRVFVVHNGLPDTVFQTRNDKESEGNSPVLSMIGRISPWKGQHVFVAAIPLVRARFPEARFRIVGAALFGEVDYQNQIRVQATRLGLDDALEWTGFRADAAEILRQTDIVVHASTLGEPFGQVIVEAMLAGKPVVATDGGGVPEIVVNGETGLLVPMGDSPALAAALIALLEDPARAREMGQAGRARAVKHFGIQGTVRGFEAIYAEMLGR